MKTVRLSFYMVPTGKTGKLKPTSYRMSPEDAAKRYPGAQPYPRDFIDVEHPETPEEEKACMYGRTTSGFLNNK